LSDPALKTGNCAVGAQKITAAVAGPYVDYVAEVEDLSAWDWKPVYAAEFGARRIQLMQCGLGFRRIRLRWTPEAW
jgi:hypothetical protein